MSKERFRVVYWCLTALSAQTHKQATLCHRNMKYIM